MITVNLFGVFRVETGLHNFLLELDEGAPVGKAILKIVALHPSLGKYWIDSAEGLSGHVLVALNGEDIYSKPLGLQTPLHSGDRLDFFSPLAGG